VEISAPPKFWADPVAAGCNNARKSPSPRSSQICPRRNCTCTSRDRSSRKTLIALAQRNGAALPYPDADALRRAYAFDNLQSFLDLYYLGLTVLQTGTDFYQMTAAYLTRVARENVRHAEVFISPQAHLRRGIAMEPIVENILAAFDDARAHHGITGGLIAGIQRQFDEKTRIAMITALKPWRDRLLAWAWAGLSSGTRHRNSARPSRWRAGDYGWGTVAHAGEEGGADYVREALDILKVDRIDHGVRCEADPDLVDRLADRGIPLTVCPCSNIMLRVFPNMKSHNIRRLHEAGLCVTVNSDDPSYFGGYINANFAVIQAALGFTDDELWQLARKRIHQRLFVGRCAQQSILPS